MYGTPCTVRTGDDGRLLGDGDTVGSGTVTTVHAVTATVPSVAFRTVSSNLSITARGQASLASLAESGTPSGIDAQLTVSQAPSVIAARLHVRRTSAEEHDRHDRTPRTPRAPRSPRRTGGR